MAITLPTKILQPKVDSTRIENLGIKELVTGFLKNPVIQARCSSHDYGTILECMVGECISSWGLEEQEEQGPVYDVIPSETDYTA